MRRKPPSGAVASARETVERHAREAARQDARAQSLAETAARYRLEGQEAAAALTGARAELAKAAETMAAAEAEAAASTTGEAPLRVSEARRAAALAREAEAKARADLESESRAREGTVAPPRKPAARPAGLGLIVLRPRVAAPTCCRENGPRLSQALDAARTAPAALSEQQRRVADELATANARRTAAARGHGARRGGSGRSGRRRPHCGDGRRRRPRGPCGLGRASGRCARAPRGRRPAGPRDRRRGARSARPIDRGGGRGHPHRSRGPGGPTFEPSSASGTPWGGVNLRAEEEAAEQAARLGGLRKERADLTDAIATLRRSIETLNAEGRERLLAAFTVISESFKALFQTLFEGGQAELRLAENDDPLEAGLEIYACPPGKRLAVMSLMSGGEQALTAMALIFAVFLANPAPVLRAGRGGRAAR